MLVVERGQLAILRPISRAVKGVPRVAGGGPPSHSPFQVSDDGAQLIECASLKVARRNASEHLRWRTFLEPVFHLRGRLPSKLDSCLGACVAARLSFCLRPHEKRIAKSANPDLPYSKVSKAPPLLEGMTGIEPAPSVWKTEALPLSYIPTGNRQKPIARFLPYCISGPSRGIRPPPRVR